MRQFVYRLNIVMLITFFSMSLNAQTIRLFNGKNLKGWHIDVPEMDTSTTATSPFIVRDSVLVSLGQPQGHLITDSIYQNYRLQVEYRFPSKPGNSGILVHTSTPRALYHMFPKSIEVQLEHGNAGDFWCIQEDIRASPDMEKRRGPKAEWGVSEGKQRRIINLTDNSEKPVGEWNTIVVECIANVIRVHVNGDLVNMGVCTASKGQIALQSEGSEVEFRKIELTKLKDRK
ncbi:MAG: DUF1080 domain-containing protein [Flavisolibacter sp.]